MQQVYLLDSTLRDGAQGESISFSIRDKLAIVESLDQLGIDFIEAGNPGSNPKDLEFFREAARLQLKHSQLLAFGPTRKKNITPQKDSGLASLLDAETATVVIFGKSWDFHVSSVLGTSNKENLAMIRETVDWLKQQGRKVMYDAEHFFDGHAANPEYAIETLRVAAEAGADCLILCDTNGGCLPPAISAATASVKTAFKQQLGIHAHNDGGLAVANTLAAVNAGAEHVQGTLAGFGERCGNANLSSIIPNLCLKMNYSCLQTDGLNLLTEMTRRVAEIANIHFDEGLPFVGQHAFAHKAGMHVDAVTKNTTTFEHVDPALVGNSRRFLASEVGGKAVILEKIRKLDPSATKDSPLVSVIVNRLKEMEAGGYQYEGAEASLELLMRKAAGRYKAFFTLGHYRTIGEQPSELRSQCASALVKISVEGESEISAAEGNGPVNALDKALRRALERFYPSLAEMHLIDFKVRVIDGSGSTDSKVRVLIESADRHSAWTTIGVSTDVIEASWLALVDSIEYKLIRDIESRYKTYLQE